MTEQTARRSKGEANNSHRILTIPNVHTHRIGKNILCSNFSNSLSKQLNNPWSNPHSTNVQFAPCHKPLTPKTIIVFMHANTTPFLEPSSGIYTYFVKNFVSEICHLFQKSRIDNALYGESKFMGRSIFSIEEISTAISL